MKARSLMVVLLMSIGPSRLAQTAAAPAKKGGRGGTSGYKPKAAAESYTGCIAAGAKPNTFMLNDATAAGSTDKTNYDLKGGKLKAHVGHKVEVTGTATKPATGDAVLAVKSTKMVAATCS